MAPAAQRTVTIPEHVPLQVLRSDRFLDRTLDILEQNATDGQVGGLARWDLKYAIIAALNEIYR